MMDDYLDHLVRHDPEGLPVALALPARENAEIAPLGTGVAWTVVRKILSGEYILDPEAGGVVFFGGVDAEGKVASLFVRLKIEDGKITESEIILNRQQGPFDAENLVNADVIWDAAVPVEKRSTRDQLMEIANGYFDALGRAEGSLVKFDKRCDRFANGLKMTNNSKPAMTAAGPESCSDSLDVLRERPGFQALGTVERRFPVVDEVRGIVVGICFFRPNPNVVHFMVERMKVVDGAIRVIDEIGVPVNKEPVSGFPADVDGGL